MFWLALKTLFHEKGRLIITLIGITVSTVLILTQVGLYIGMMGDATAIIRNTPGDLWVTSKNIQNVDFSNPIPEDRINKVRSMPEVIWAKRLILTWGYLKTPSGGLEQVQIVGFDPDSGVGAPWKMVEGSAEDVKGGPYMILDRTAEKRLGGLEVGSVWELSNRRFKLVGISDGIKSFTTSPVVFLSYSQAQQLSSGPVRQGNASFVVARLQNPDDGPEVAARLRGLMKNNDVFTKAEFMGKTIRYWTIQTGMGMAFFLTAMLALIVGGAIVGQTIYAGTMEHLREFGTLKAIGAKNRDIYTVIFSQAAINAVIGYAVGAGFIALTRDGIMKAGVTLYTGPLYYAVLFVVVLATCVLSSWFSVRKIRTLDPVTVFKA